MLSKFNIRYSDMVMKKGDQDFNKSKEFTKGGGGGHPFFSSITILKIGSMCLSM